MQKIIRRDREAVTEGCDCGTMLAVKLFSSPPSLPLLETRAVFTHTHRDARQTFSILKHC